MSASNPAAPEPTEIAGRFQVVRKLGAGAFGTVYKAKDKVLGRMLAIKTIRLEGLAASKASLDELLDRFKREAQVAAQLRHPNIVTIYDIGEADGLTYLSMELIDGVGLDSVIAETGRMPVERAAALGAQVADALDYAHRHSVVHRDIKPANIMVEAGDRVKVTDFGIAKVTDSAEHLTMTGSLLGTPSYMSPEQARGQTLDGRSDLFSLGCVIYEMAAGHKAFRGESITALLFKIITEAPQPIREVDPSVPEEMARLIDKAIAKSPEARYQTGRELADDLLALTKAGFLPTLRAIDAPTLPASAPTSSPTIASAPTRVSPATLARGTTTASTQPAGGPPPLAPTILTPGAAAIPGAPATKAAPARAPRPSAAAPKSGSGVGLLLGLAVVGAVLVAALGVGAWAFLRHRPASQPGTSATPVADAAATVSPATSLPSGAAVPDATTATSLPAESGPTPGGSTTSAATSTATPSAPRVAAAPRGTPTTRGESGSGAAVSSPLPAHDETSQMPAQGGDFSFLDQVPAEPGDGRAAGEALAQRYRAGGSSGLAGRRFNARPRIPRGLAPFERPAVATLLHLSVAEEAYHATNGRYGNLHELKAAGLLRLDVPFAKGVFDRARYRFELTGGTGEFKIRATPLAGTGRPFVTDENGFVLVDE